MPSARSPFYTNLIRDLQGEIHLDRVARRLRLQEGMSQVKSVSVSFDRAEEIRKLRSELLNDWNEVLKKRGGLSAIFAQLSTQSESDGFPKFTGTFFRNFGTGFSCH